MDFTLMPTRDAFTVQVRDARLPRGKRAVVKDRYFATRPAAEQYQTDMRVQYPAPVTVELRECML